PSRRASSPWLHPLASRNAFSRFSKPTSPVKSSGHYIPDVLEWTMTSVSGADPREDEDLMSLAFLMREALEAAALREALVMGDYDPTDACLDGSFDLSVAAVTFLRAVSERGGACIPPTA